jgi:acetoin utilization protein AcuB
MLVKEIMSTEVITIGRNDDLLGIEQTMASKKLRHLPVVEDGELVGIVTQRDLFKAAMSSAMGYGQKAQEAYLHKVLVKEIMVYPVITVSPTTSLREAIDLILARGIGCLPVVENGALVGLVTKTDLLRHLRSTTA